MVGSILSILSGISVRSRSNLVGWYRCRQHSSAPGAGDWICAAGLRQIRNAVRELISLNYFILGVSPSPTI